MTDFEEKQHTLFRLIEELADAYINFGSDAYIIDEAINAKKLLSISLWISTKPILGQDP